MAIAGAPGALGVRAAGQTAGRPAAPARPRRHGADQRHHQEREQRCPARRARVIVAVAGECRTARRAQRRATAIRADRSAGRRLTPSPSPGRVSRRRPTRQAGRSPATPIAVTAGAAGGEHRFRARRRRPHHRAHPRRRRHAVRGRRRRRAGLAIRERRRHAVVRRDERRQTTAASSGSSAWLPASTTSAPRIPRSAAWHARRACCAIRRRTSPACRSPTRRARSCVTGDRGGAARRVPAEARAAGARRRAALTSDDARQLFSARDHHEAARRGRRPDGAAGGSRNSCRTAGSASVRWCLATTRSARAARPIRRRRALRGLLAPGHGQRRRAGSR